jgi:hypothetical protein
VTRQQLKPRDIEIYSGDVTAKLTSSVTYVRFEVFTAVTTKNSVFWDIKIQSVPHRKHITSFVQGPAGKYYVTFDVSTAVTMKNAVFWDVTLCGSCKNRHFGGMYRFHRQSEKNRRARNNVSNN